MTAATARELRILNETLAENTRLRAASAERDGLRTVVKALLFVAERMHDDPSFDPQEWYVVRDYARRALNNG